MSELPDGFDSLAYPGKTKPKNRVAPAPEPSTPETQGWDERPAHYVVGGEKREFFLIGHVAKALGYSVQSIRLWEGQGLLPRSPFRSPRTRGMVAGGRSNKGRRLWTRAQVEAILSIAKKHEVILNREPPTAEFAREVAQEFALIQQQATATADA